MHSPRLPLVVVVLLTLCSPAIAAEGWWQFRGPGGQGHSESTGLPLTWSETENVAWRVPVDGLSWSSPSVEGSQIWLTTATDNNRSLRAVAFDLKSGSQLHDVEVFHKDDPGRVHTKNSHASPTPLIEGDRVYVHFGAHGTACLSTAGQVIWRNDELKYKHGHGPGGSPVVWNDLLLVNCDGTDVQFLAAFDKRTGELRWKKDRQHAGEARRTGKSQVPMAYSTPLLIDVAGRTQLICAVSDHVVAYEPGTGEEIWWSTYDGYSNVMRPVYAHGLIFVSSGFDAPVLYAVRADGKGDVTETHAAWHSDRGAPLSVSPLVVGDELYTLTDGGIATCFDAVSGEQRWQKRIGSGFSASPLLVDGRIYLLDENGTTTVIAPGRQFKQLAVNKLPGRTLASLAVADGAFLLRTDSHLYRLQNK